MDTCKKEKSTDELIEEIMDMLSSTKDPKIIDRIYNLVSFATSLSKEKLEEFYKAIGYDPSTGTKAADMVERAEKYIAENSK